jgi:hypothetical protein
MERGGGATPADKVKQYYSVRNASHSAISELWHSIEDDEGGRLGPP